jgi:hypothetical protein
VRLRLRARLAWAVGASSRGRHSGREPPKAAGLPHRPQLPPSQQPGGGRDGRGRAGCHTESLDRQLGILRSHFTFISLERLLRHLEGQPLPPNPALVTFDDGYRDNLTNAVPILAASRRPGHVLHRYRVCRETAALLVGPHQLDRQAREEAAIHAFSS